MNAKERRSHLAGEPNPDPRLDYVVEIKAEVATAGGGRAQAAVVLRYVPDRQVIKPGSFGQYLRVLEGLGLATLEALAAVILDDLNNELVCRWVQVTLSTATTVHPGIQSHAVVIEDRQPSWDNPGLLSRLRRF